MWRSIDRGNIKVSSQPVDNTAAESGGCGRCQQATLDFNQQHDLAPEKRVGRLSGLNNQLLQLINRVENTKPTVVNSSCGVRLFVDSAAAAFIVTSPNKGGNKRSKLARKSKCVSSPLCAAVTVLLYNVTRFVIIT